MKIFQRIRCFIVGHSHPWFSCVYCGKPSSLGFKRDEHGNVVRDERGEPIVIKVRA